MPSLGAGSNAKLDTCDPRLAAVIREAVKVMDLTVIFGYRSPELQQALYRQGRKLKNGKWVVADAKKVVTKIDGVKVKGQHNHYPSRAVDVAPYPVDWSNKPKAIARFYLLAGVVLGIAHKLGIRIRWGGDWDGDFDLSDQTFDDLGHYEVVD